METYLQPNDLILFQGDSITDCSRHKLKHADLGQGYVNLINHYIQSHHPELNIQCLNKGMSGNRSFDLMLRWKHDCIRLEPSVLSLLLGINDTWRRYDLGLVTSEVKFREHYVHLMDTLVAAYPNIRLVLMSPFLLPVSPEQELWFEDLNPKIEITRQIAAQYNAIYIPLQEIFTEHLSPTYPANYWTVDGVHPTLEGHGLIAKAWLKAVTKGDVNYDGSK